MMSAPKRFPTEINLFWRVIDSHLNVSIGGPNGITIVAKKPLAVVAAVIIIMILVW